MRVLLVDKPAGWTSHDLVAVARGSLKERKIGHAGTLDPFATGLMVLGVGRATRLLEYMVGLDKEYEAALRLGIGTDTHDPEGQRTAMDDSWRALGPGRIRAEAAEMTGTLDQRPPRYSAVKIRGVPAYRRVRRGETVKIAPRPVTIRALEVTEIALPTLRIRVSCSSGTYIRSLAAELGRRLGTSAHLTALRRLRVGALRIERAAPLTALRSGALPASSWIEPAAALAHLGRLAIGPREEADVALGRRIRANIPDADPVMALGAGDRILAVGAVKGGVFRPGKVFPHVQ